MTSTYDVAFLTGGTIGALALTYKITRLYRYGGHPRSWALTISLMYATGTALFSAPTFANWFDDTTGVDSFATLLEAIMELGFACGALSLVTYWRYPARRACELVWRFSRVFFVVVGIMAALFAMSSFPGSHEVDFISQYAHQPTVSAFILAYLIPAIIAVAASTRGCGRAARDPDIADVAWLRRVLRCLQIGVGFAMLHLLGELFGLFAVWFDWHGTDWVSPAASAASAAGFVPGAIAAVLPGIERLKPRLLLAAERWQVFVLLLPLHHALRFVNPAVVFVAKGKRVDPHHRVRRQLLEISEWRWTLAPRFDPEVRAAAERIGRERGLPEPELAAAIEASQLKAAIQCRRAARTAARPEATQDGSGLDSEYTWWLAVAHAFRSSSVVTAAVAEASEGRSRGFLFTSGR
ncbi:MAG: MAB_1171c family putative transporter [Kibdelosporangium sp.]